MFKKFQAKVSIKTINNKITVVASDETLDRHGEVLAIESWDLSKFKSAPRMLVDHDHRVEKIVGKWVNVRIEGKELLMEPEFHNFTDLAKAVEQMVNEGFLDTVSVGFIPHSPTEDGGRDSFELIETSWVTVPANPNAQVTSRMKTLENTEVTEEVKKEVEKFVGEEKKEEVKVYKTLEEMPKDISDQGSLLCEAQLISQLVADSKKLQTLTEQYETLKQVVASNNKRKEKLFQDALKEVARSVNDTLRKAKVII